MYILSACIDLLYFFQAISNSRWRASPDSVTWYSCFGGLSRGGCGSCRRLNRPRLHRSLSWECRVFLLTCSLSWRCASTAAYSAYWSAAYSVRITYSCKFSVFTVKRDLDAILFMGYFVAHFKYCRLWVIEVEPVFTGVVRRRIRYRYKASGSRTYLQSSSITKRQQFMSYGDCSGKFQSPPSILAR